MSTPTTATATLPPNPHYRHHAHHHYPPYSHLQSHGATYRTGVAAPSTAQANPILPTSNPAAATSIAASSPNTSATISAVSSSVGRHLPPPYGIAATTPGGFAGLHAPSGVVTNGGSAAVARLPSHDSRRTGSGSRPRSEATHENMVSTGTATQSRMDSQPRKRRRSKGADWARFYENGLPEEVILIHDGTPDPQNGGENAGAGYSMLTYSNGASNGVDAATHHVAKKRRKDSGQQPEVSQNGRNQTSQNAASNSGSTSTDRTTSANNTTAPTSLGSLSSNGQYEYEAQQIGQKRKRTRHQIAQEAKRREVEVIGDSHITYRPPAKPVKKSGEVSVRLVNDRYQNVKVDDDDGHYIVVPDADLTPQFTMLKLLGQGTFGKVVQARDKKRNKLVAIKIIRSVQKYRDASRIELRVLQTLRQNDEENRNRCIHFRDCFDYRGHICIVMDLLGCSVFDFLKSNNFVPFPNSQIQNFARQLLTSVAFLHDLNLIHTDLKPENILLCDAAYQTFTYNRRIPSSSTAVSRQATQRKVLLDTEIRLIDFGSATFEDEYHSSVVSTRHYRAPEIILGLGWSFPCDIWSIGCILVEFFTGDALFQTHDNLEHLAMMENVCGSKIDSHLIQQVSRMSSRSGGSGGNPASKYFKRLKLDYPGQDTTRASKRFVKNMKRLHDIIPNSNGFLRGFLDLLDKIFVYDPSKRITAREALDHHWFREVPTADDGTEAAKIRHERSRPLVEQQQQHQQPPPQQQQLPPDYSQARLPPITVS